MMQSYNYALKLTDQFLIVDALIPRASMGHPRCHHLLFIACLYLLYPCTLTNFLRHDALLCSLFYKKSTCAVKFSPAHIFALEPRLLTCRDV